MPVRARQLFVRCGSLDALGEALARVRLEGEYVALHDGGWATVVGDAIEPALARSLSARFGTALVIDLEGASLSLVVQTWDGGEPGEEDVDPRPPAFRDVEAVAWELLQYLGVPASLRLLKIDDLELSAGVPALRVRDEVERTSALPPQRVEGASPPVEPDVVVESKASEARALEVRDLPAGIPTEAWAQSLAAIEEAQARRLLRALAGVDEPRVPRPAFAYRSLQPVRMEKLLARARRERLWLAKLFDPEREAPLSVAGLTQLARSRLADMPVARAHGVHLELRAGDAVVRAPVLEVYEVYLTHLDESAAADDLASRARALASGKPGPFDHRHLLPTLVGHGPGAHPALLYDDGVWISPALEVPDFAAALARAVENMDTLTDAAPEGIRWFDLDHGRVVVGEFSDAACAGRLLSRRARQLLLKVLGEERALAAAPTRDALLACAASDEEGAAWLREEAARRFAEGPYPISPVLWLLTADAVTVIGDSHW